jgi:hypothetical protein
MPELEYSSIYEQKLLLLQSSTVYIMTLRAYNVPATTLQLGSVLCTYTGTGEMTRIAFIAPGKPIHCSPCHIELSMSKTPQRRVNVAYS